MIFFSLTEVNAVCVLSTRKFCATKWQMRSALLGHSAEAESSLTSR